MQVRPAVPVFDQQKARAEESLSNQVQVNLYDIGTQIEPQSHTQNTILPNYNLQFRPSAPIFGQHDFPFSAYSTPNTFQQISPSKSAPRNRMDSILENSTSTQTNLASSELIDQRKPCNCPKSNCKNDHCACRKLKLKCLPTCHQNKDCSNK